MKAATWGSPWRSPPMGGVLIMRLKIKNMARVRIYNSFTHCGSSSGLSKSGLALSRIQKIRLATVDQCSYQNPVTPAKAGAHRRTGSRPSPGRRRGGSDDISIAIISLTIAGLSDSMPDHGLSHQETQSGSRPTIDGCLAAYRGAAAAFGKSPLARSQAGQRAGAQHQYLWLQRTDPCRSDIADHRRARPAAGRPGARVARVADDPPCPSQRSKSARLHDRRQPPRRGCGVEQRPVAGAADGTAAGRA